MRMAGIEMRGNGVLASAHASNLGTADIGDVSSA